MSFLHITTHTSVHQIIKYLVIDVIFSAHTHVIDTFEFFMINNLQRFCLITGRSTLQIFLYVQWCILVHNSPCPAALSGTPPGSPAINHHGTPGPPWLPGKINFANFLCVVPPWSPLDAHFLFRLFQILNFNQSQYDYKSAKSSPPPCLQMSCILRSTTKLTLREPAIKVITISNLNLKII